MDQFLLIDWSFIDNVGDNPFQAMWFFFANGGWIAILIVMLWACVKFWVQYKQNLFGAKKQFVVLAIDVPRTSEQGARAAENMFAYLSGAHSPNNFKEQWFEGKTQDNISLELVSIEGHVQYVIRTTRQLRDLIEAAVYAQYPDAEIVEVEDYARKVPVHYPDEEWDMWGIEMVPVKSDVYPIKTYSYFEDKLSLEFKDPLSSFLEGFSRLGQGEQAWFQIIIKPIGQVDFQKKATALINKLTGKKVEAKKNLMEKAIDLPIKTGGIFLEQLIGTTSEPVKKKEEGPPAILRMTPGERGVVEAIENKCSKICFLTKIRFIYIGKKEVISKPRIVYSFMGSIKQFNTNDMQSLKPETKKVGMNSALWFFKAQRNNARKTRLLMAYRNRSDWSGMPTFHMSAEELATLWHFPHSLQIKAPQLKKTESKKSEPPYNIPFA